MFLSFEKKDEYLRKQLIFMLENCVKKMHVFDYIEEFDTPENLIAKKGLFYQLYKESMA